MTPLVRERRRRRGRGRRVALTVAAGAVVLAVAVPALPHAGATSPYPTSPSSGSPSSSPSSSSSSSAAPPVPVLAAARQDAGSSTATDRRAPLVVSNVGAGSGSVASVKIKYGPNSTMGLLWTDDLPVVTGRTTYQHTAVGLDQLRNGTEYEFVAEVCNTGGRCSTSVPLIFAPYVTPAAPVAGGLAVYQPGSTAGMGSDRHAPLVIGGVHPVAGSMASVTVYSGPSSAKVSSLRWTDAVSVTAGRWQLQDSVGVIAYEVSAYGGGHLVNGREYQFVVQACNTAGRCSRSAPLRFTPYGIPSFPKPTVRVSGLTYQVSWGPVAMNGYPGTVSCKVMVVDSATHQVTWSSTVADPAQAGSTTRTGTAGTFTAELSCSWAGGRGNGGADSDPFTLV